MGGWLVDWVGSVASCGTSSALKCNDRALHKFVWLGDAAMLP